MSRLYGEQHRALQDHFQTRKLADRAEELVVQTEVGDTAKAFIETRDMFFLSTIAIIKVGPPSRIKAAILGS